MSASFCLDFSVTLFITESSKFSLSEKHVRKNEKKKPQTPKKFVTHQGQPSTSLCLHFKVGLQGNNTDERDSSTDSEM